MILPYTFLRMASHLRRADCLASSLKGGNVCTQITDNARAYVELESRIGLHRMSDFFDWLERSSCVGLPLKSIAATTSNARTVSVIKKMSLTKGQVQEDVTFQLAPFDILTLLAPVRSTFEIRRFGSPDGINFIAYTPDALLGVSMCHRIRFALDDSSTTHSVTTSSEDIFFDKSFQDIGFAFLLMIHLHMVSTKMMGERLPGAPVATQVLQKVLAHGCRMAGIVVTPELAANHEQGILTRAESQAFWTFALGAGMIHDDLSGREIFPAAITEFAREATLIRGDSID